jgi:hypothetical protein
VKHTVWCVRTKPIPKLILRWTNRISQYGTVSFSKIINQYLTVEEYNTDCNEEDTGRPEWVNRQDKTPIITS